MRETGGRLAAIVRRDLLLCVRQPLSGIVGWFSPVIAIAGFYFVARLVDPHHALLVDGRQSGYFRYVCVNLCFMLLATSALQAFAQTVRYDQIVGTLEPIFATSMPAGAFAAGCGIWPLAASCAQVAFCLGIAATFMGLDLRATDGMTLVTFLLLSTLTMAAIGLFSAAGVIAFRQVPPSNYLVGGAASLLAGTLFPTHLFPPALQVLSWCLPLTHVLRGLRGAIAGDPLPAIAGDALWLAVAVLLLLPSSLVVLSRAVARARDDGTLAHY